jgi:hypothetical protein
VASQPELRDRHVGDHRPLVVTVETEPLDLVVEGRATKVRHEDTLRRVAGAYASIYDWHVRVRDGAFHYAGGATTAGGEDDE